MCWMARLARPTHGGGCNGACPQALCLTHTRGKPYCSPLTWRNTQFGGHGPHHTKAYLAMKGQMPWPRKEDKTTHSSGIPLLISKTFRIHPAQQPQSRGVHKH